MVSSKYTSMAQWASANFHCVRLTTCHNDNGLKSNLPFVNLRTIIYLMGEFS